MAEKIARGQRRPELFCKCGPFGFWVLPAPTAFPPLFFLLVAFTMIYEKV